MADEVKTCLADLSNGTADTRSARTRVVGSSVATTGDVNGDGYADVPVGAYAYMKQIKGIVRVALCKRPRPPPKTQRLIIKTSEVLETSEV